MDEYVRVADKETGHHVSITRHQYETNPDAWRELQSDAVYPDGTPRPVKYKTDVSTEASKKSGGQKAPAGEQE